LLTLLKIKTATSSAYPIYVKYDEPLPQVGSYSIILDKQDHAVCIIQTTEVTIIPFDQVNDEHAYLEGEGDRTLDYWRKYMQIFLHRKWKIWVSSFIRTC